MSDDVPHLEPHPLALMFPRMLPEAFEELCENIQIYGLQTPIVLFQNQILEGVNRYNACLREQMPIRTENFEGDEIAAFHYVINVNLYRRELTESQRAICVCDVRKTIDRIRINDPSYTQEALARKFKTSRTMVHYALSVIQSGQDELVQAIRDGTMSVANAATLLTATDDLRHRALLHPEQAPKLAKEVKRQERLNKQSNKTLEQSTALGEKLYNVIYADPPWHFQVYSDETGMDKAAENHYPTMEMGALLDLQIPAADDCVMFMWVTVPHLAQGIELLAQWGFEYKSAWFWDKQSPGTGFWFRNQVEMILVATKGSISAPTPGEQPPQLISEAKTTHSTKPEVFAEWIAKIYPNMPKLEMFARKPRHGWDAWGNEVGYVH
ncbi:MAG TPA: MT-A70 family methyltransferase, partial [Pyrinomonadaceae bacterium]